MRHLQRTEVLEAEEYFSPGQKGSSAMPHKRNPVLTENLTGLARLVRMAVTPAMEDVALWHERDISHSSVERAIAPDATVTLDFALARLTNVVDRLVVYPETMMRNMNKFRGLIHSQRVLLALTQKGVSERRQIPFRHEDRAAGGALSHFASSASCVVFRTSSIPSTTNNFPGYSCGVVRLFSMRCLFRVLGPATSNRIGMSSARSSGATWRWAAHNSSSASPLARRRAR